MLLFFFGLFLGFALGALAARPLAPVTSAPKPPQDEPPLDDLERPSGVGACGVPNCRISRPHSHVEAFIDKLKGR